MRAANHWQWAKGRLAVDAIKDSTNHHTSIWRLAETLADQACRAVEADDLRHACHIHAFDRDISHTKLTNEQFDRLLLLLGDERTIRGLLICPDVRAQMLWDNPAQAKKLSLIRSIKGLANDEYICAITKNVFGTIYWEDLESADLLGLLRKIKGNQPS